MDLTQKKKLLNIYIFIYLKHALNGVGSFCLRNMLKILKLGIKILVLSAEKKEN